MEETGGGTGSELAPGECEDGEETRDCGWDFDCSPGWEGNGEDRRLVESEWADVSKLVATLAPVVCGTEEVEAGREAVGRF